MRVPTSISQSLMCRLFRERDRAIGCSSPLWRLARSDTPPVYGEMQHPLSSTCTHTHTMSSSHRDKSKRYAEQSAAEVALYILNIHPHLLRLAQQ